MINVFLRLAVSFQPSLGHHEGMISLLNDMQFGRRFHFGTNGLKETKRAERIPGPLNEEDRRPEVEKHSVAQLPGFSMVSPAASPWTNFAIFGEQGSWEAGC